HALIPRRHTVPLLPSTTLFRSCLQAARSNAHAVRGRITADMWENINATWLEMRGIAEQGLGRYGISRFCEWVKERSHLFRGATLDRKSTRLNSSHVKISYAVFC